MRTNNHMELITMLVTTGNLRLTLPRFVTLLIALLCGLNSEVAAQSFGGVLTWHNDVARTGQNSNESILTPQNVKNTKFGKVFSCSLDGQTYAQPLYVPNVSIPGQ